MATEDTTLPDLSATGRPYPVVPFPAGWLTLFGGLSVAATPAAAASDDQTVTAEPGQGPTDPQT